MQVFDQMTCEREIISQAQNILFNALFIHLMKFEIPLASTSITAGVALRSPVCYISMKQRTDVMGVYKMILNEASVNKEVEVC